MALPLRCFWGKFSRKIVHEFWWTYQIYINIKSEPLVHEKNVIK